MSGAQTNRTGSFRLLSSSKHEIGSSNKEEQIRTRLISHQFLESSQNMCFSSSEVLTELCLLSCQRTKQGFLHTPHCWCARRAGVCTRMRPIADLGSAGRPCSLLDSRERVGRGGSLPCYLPPSLPHTNQPANPPTWWESATLSLPLSPLHLTHQASPLSSTALSGEPAAGNRGLQWWGVGGGGVQKCLCAAATPARLALPPVA